jgi:hypothetical protein
LRRSVIKLRGELEAANKTISELRGSGPGPLEPKGESPKGGTKDWESEFDEKMGG